MGFSWESLVIEEIIRGLEASGITFNYYYYRTSQGAEIDLILEGKFGLIPIEIKYPAGIKPNTLQPIKVFIKEHNCTFGIIVSNGDKVMQYDKNLFVVPFSFCI